MTFVRAYRLIWLDQGLQWLWCVVVREGTLCVLLDSSRRAVNEL
jgi:hypothetical protein